MTNLLSGNKKSGTATALLSDRRVWLVFIFLGMLFSKQCIDPFNPEIDDTDELLVIDGSLIKGAEEQIVSISFSAPLNMRAFNPVSGCNVKVIDEAGAEIVFREKSEGTYSGLIADDYLQFNHRYKLSVITPDGNHYESDYETLIESAPVDSVYGIVEKGYSTEKESEKDVFQFYIDLKASEEDSRYYRWELEETWENHSRDFIDALLYEDTLITVADKDALFYCWTTREVIGLYSANTLNLLRNEKKKIPLNNVDGTTQRLSVKYSLLVRQYALNEGAYNYWNDKRVVLEESGGLYTSQPSQLISNIRNVNDPEENVLGYFWASSVSEKRIFTRRPPGMRVNMMDCELISIDSIDFAAVIYPLHMVILDEERWVLTNYCADCLYKGETNIKPDFWEDK